jgi:hypothetical protein
MLARTAGDLQNQAALRQHAFQHIEDRLPIASDVRSMLAGIRHLRHVQSDILAWRRGFRPPLQTGQHEARDKPNDGAERADGEHRRHVGSMERSKVFPENNWIIQ